ncbi:MAG: glycosyltransferase N-terminal domain-containing protein [Pseudomonadota bacterium]
MSRSAALAAYLAISQLAGPLASTILRRRLNRGKEDPLRVKERLGNPSLARPQGRLVWLHGASIGEAMSMQPLIHAILGASDATALVTTGTVTSARRVATVLPPRAIHQYVPVDTASAVRRFLDHWRPDLAVWVESELWPALVHQTAERTIPMALVNARLSARSAARWKRAPMMARSLLGAFRIVSAQDGETVARLRDLGIDAAQGGNLKAVIDVPPCDAAVLAEACNAVGDRPVWLAASTHPEDDAVVLGALERMTPDVLCILAPRHPDRKARIVEMLNAASLSCALRSEGEFPGVKTRVWLADTLGEMGLWYRLAPVSLIGGGFGSQGGHSPFEGILLGSALLHGPDTANFAPVYRALENCAGSTSVTDGADLAKQVMTLLDDPELRESRVRNASAAHQAMRPDPNALARELLALMEHPG